MAPCASASAPAATTSPPNSAPIARPPPPSRSLQPVPPACRSGNDWLVRRTLEAFNAFLQVRHRFFERSETSIEIYVRKAKHRLRLRGRSVDLLIQSLFRTLELFAKM